MDKRRLKVALKVLEKVKTKYVETKDLIEDECQREKISVEEVIFFQVQKQRVSPEKHFLFRSEYVKRYFIKLNSLGYNIYLRVIQILFTKTF